MLGFIFTPLNLTPNITYQKPFVFQEPPIRSISLKDVFLIQLFLCGQRPHVGFHYALQCIYLPPLADC